MEVLDRTVQIGSSILLQGITALSQYIDIKPPGRLHTHHINEQHTADEKGMIKHFHKNIKFNLMIVCESCHNQIHNE